MGAVRPVALACLICAACYPDAGSPPRYDAGQTSAGPRDLSLSFDPYDGEGPWGDVDLGEIQGPDPCGDPFYDRSCFTVYFEGPFPLRQDPNPDPLEKDQGVARGADGYLRLANMELSGTYRRLVGGCMDVGTGEHNDTMWYRVNWEGDVPADTSLQVRAQSGNWTGIDDAGWQGALWTMAGAISPLDLQATLTPNLTPGNRGDIVNDAMLRVEVQLQSQVAGKTPYLRRLEIAFKCFHGD